MMTTPEMIGAAGLSITVIGILMREAARGARIETKLDASLTKLQDHEDRLRDLEKAPAPVATGHLKPEIRQHAI